MKEGYPDMCKTLNILLLYVSFHSLGLLMADHSINIVNVFPFTFEVSRENWRYVIPDLALA
jgi:hypothetical protein